MPRARRPLPEATGAAHGLHDRAVVRLTGEGTLLPAAASVLATHEPESRDLLSPYPDAHIRIGVADRELCWLDRRARGPFRPGTAAPPRGPDAVLWFRDHDVATLALAGESNHLAAVGAGEIAVRGLVPLADALGEVMGRAAEYLR